LDRALLSKIILVGWGSFKIKKKQAKGDARVAKRVQNIRGSRPLEKIIEE